MITKFIEIAGNTVNAKTLEKQATYFGKSTDKKPTEQVNNADMFYEIDTKKVFLFDEDGKTWIEQ